MLKKALKFLIQSGREDHPGAQIILGSIFQRQTNVSHTIQEMRKLYLIIKNFIDKVKFLYSLLWLRATQN